MEKEKKNKRSRRDRDNQTEKPTLNAPCKVRAVDVDRSRARSERRWLFGTLTSIKGDTATIILDGGTKPYQGRVVQAAKGDVVIKGA